MTDPNQPIEALLAEKRSFPPSEDFLKQAVTDYIILIPKSQKSSYPLRAYIKVPYADCEHWIKADDEAASGFAGRFNKMSDEASEKQPRPA